MNVPDTKLGRMFRQHIQYILDKNIEALLDQYTDDCLLISSFMKTPKIYRGRAELREHMQRNLGRPIYLDDLARRARMSKFAFVRKFKRLCGRTPMRELQLLRVNQARAMMLASGLPVKAIAAAVGLNDEYQLSKLFRRHLRLSPREMRARSQPA